MDTQERRGGERLTRVFPVSLRGPAGSLDTHALDVSRGGVRILCPQRLSEEDSVQLTLELEPDLCVSLEGRPVWQQPLNRAGYHMVGLCFTDVATELLRWLREQ